MKSSSTKSSNYIFYGLTIFLSISIILYLSYTTFITNDNMRNNTKNIVEENDSINIYKESLEQYMLSSYSTKIYDNDKNRIHNIKLACNKLNGYLVAPNTEFSFNQTLGKMDKENGYKKATGFDNSGNKIKIYGGGICQLSSTLYNAVLNCKLDVTERHAHSRRVNYVPKNKDATICYGGHDFKFINNTKYNIVIYAKTDGTTVTIELVSFKNNIT